MKKILKDERGLAVNLVLAMVLVAVSLGAMASVLELIADTRNDVLWMQDKMQQQLFMRSEAKRVNFQISNGMPIEPRTIEMIARNRVASYRLVSEERSYTIPGTSSDSPAKRIETICYTKHARKAVPKELSPVRTYSVNVSSRETIAQFQYFSVREISDITNDPESAAARVNFYGADELNGPVHSNDDIVILNSGDSVGNNEGWPLFLAPVTTAGEILVQQGSGGDVRPLAESDPIDQIFRGGLRTGKIGAARYAGVKEIEYKADATELVARGNHIMSRHYDIAYVNMKGGQFDIQYADVKDRIQPYGVYYDINIPPPGSPGPHPAPYFTQYIAVPDTFWHAPDARRFASEGFYFPTTVWVKGEVSGRLTIGSSEDSYTLGHIKYTGTSLGQFPDAAMGWNTRDMFGLVSEGKIMIKYKYKETWPGGFGTSRKTVFSPNAEGPSGNVFLYGAYSAQGAADPNMGDFAYKQEGTFTYETQHPHGSPKFFYWVGGSDTMRTYVAFHIFHYPQRVSVRTGGEFGRLRQEEIPPPSFGEPYVPGVTRYRVWPGESTPAFNGAGTPPNSNINTQQPEQWTMYDYPFLNPNYPEWCAGTIPNNPEGEITYMRGDLWVIGSIAQRRRGFIRRSGRQTPDNPDTQSFWDVPNYVFGGAHYATGYNKRYYYDNRLLYMPPPLYPEVYSGHRGALNNPYREDVWSFTLPPARHTVYSATF